MEKKDQSDEEKLLEKIKKDSANKIKHQKDENQIMFGLGLFGLVGWSIAIPTLIGTAIGVYLDNRFTQSFSWTLTFLFAGIILGLFNAWHWIKEKTKGD